MSSNLINIFQPVPEDREDKKNEALYFLEASLEYISKEGIDCPTVVENIFAAIYLIQSIDSEHRPDNYFNVISRARALNNEQ